MTASVLERASYHVPLHRIPVVKPRFWTLDRGLGLVLATVGAVPVAWGVALFPALLGDEGIYTSQAQSTLHGELTPYTYTYDHPFLGWLQLAPLQGLIHLVVGNGQLLVVEGRLAMVPYAWLTLLFTFHIARRLDVSRIFAFATVALLALSPLYIAESRTVLLDNIALPWVLGSFYLALTPSRRQWIYGLSAVMFAVGVLSKETVVLLLPVLLYVVWTRSYAPIRMMTIATFVTLGTLVIAIYPLFALLRNELIPGPGHVSLWSNGILYQLSARKGSGAVWQNGSGRQTLVAAWLAQDRVLPIAGAACALVCLCVKRLWLIGFALLLWAVPVVKPGGYLPQMYVILALPLCALAVGGTLDALASGIGRLGRPRAVRAGVGLLCAVLAVPVLAGFASQDRRITTDGANNKVEAARQAEAWIFSHSTKRDNLLIDPAYYGDLVDHGFGHPWRGAISYYQFDLDPVSSSTFLPQQWRDIDFIVETHEMRSNLAPLGLTRLTAAIAHSHPVARFGTGSNTVVVRAVRATAYNQGGSR